MGLYLTGDGLGNFSPVPFVNSGFFTPHDAKDMKMITIGQGKNKKQVILANNQEMLQAIEYDPGAVQEKVAKALSIR